MLVSSIHELETQSVLNPGIPNEECIAIKVNSSINMGQYAIMIGSSGGDTSAIPFKDNLFWFGEAMVNSGDWIFIYTGSGIQSEYKTADKLNNIFNLYWNKPNTLFANTNIVPMLIRIDAVDVPAPPNNLPHHIST